MDDRTQADWGSRLQTISEGLNAFHHRLREVEKCIRDLETEAESLGLPRVRFALKDAYTRVTSIGGVLVDAHVQLGHAEQQINSSPDTGAAHG